MNLRRWTHLARSRAISDFADSLSGRFMGAIAVTIVVGFFLHAALVHFTAGQWMPPIEESGIAPQAVQTARIMEVAPRALRASLAEGASSGGGVIRWYPTLASAEAAAKTVPSLARKEPALLDALRHAGLQEATVLALKGREVVAADRAVPPAQRMPHHAFNLLVRLSDGSWLVLSSDRKIWGPGKRVRLLEGAVLLSLIAIAVSVLYGWRLAHPVRAFIRGVDRFAVDIQARPLPLVGPSELKIAASAVNAMQARIQDFVTQRTLLLATISHDLRTPLTRLRLRSEALADEAARRAFMADIDDMTAMVQGALGLFNDEHEEVEPFTLLDLGALVQVLADEFADMGAKVQVHAGAIVSARGRPRALKRAIGNVLDNALRYGREVEVSVALEQGIAEVVVSDRGPGLPPDALERVFQPFQRMTSSSRPATDGVGLGLTSARTIIGLHGGSVSAQNRPGGGLAVMMRWPAELNAQSR